MNNPHTSLAKLFVEDALWRPGPPATIVRELGQVRKEAAAADDLCAGMWLGLHPTDSCNICSHKLQEFFIFAP